MAGHIATVKYQYAVSAFKQPTAAAAAVLVIVLLSLVIHDGTASSFASASAMVTAVPINSSSSSSSSTTTTTSTTTAAVPATVSLELDLATTLYVGGISQLDRSRYFNVHGAPGPSDWRPQDVALFTNTSEAGGLDAFVGREFTFTGRMPELRNDPLRPGYVDVAQLVRKCTSLPPKLGNWPESHVDIVASSKTAPLYPHHCAGSNPPTPPPPSPSPSPPLAGFVPGSHNATAEYFSLYYAHCLLPTTRTRILVEVANECNVKVQRCNTTWDEMIALHIAVADRLHKDHGHGQPHHNSNADGDDAMPVPKVFGPTAAFPEFNAGGHLSNFLRGMGPFIEEAGPHLDGLSVHLYDTMTNTSYLPGAPMVPRSGSNVLAITELMSAHSYAHVGRALPLMVSEYGTGTKIDPPAYSRTFDWQIMRGVTGKLMYFLSRPDVLVKTIPFITAKASWHKGPDPYPFVLWRLVNNSTWLETDLMMFFRTWRDVTGARFRVASSDASVQVQGFRNAGSNKAYVAVNNLASHNVTAGIKWVWPAAAAAGSSSSAVPPTHCALRRLGWNAAQLHAVMSDDTVLPNGPPASLELPAHGFALLILSWKSDSAAAAASPMTATATKKDTAVASPAAEVATTAVNETALYAREGTLINITGSVQQFSFERAQADSTATTASVAPTPLYGRLRVGLSGNYTSMDLAPRVTVNGHNIAYDARAVRAGDDHVDTKTGDFLGALDIPLTEQELSGGSNFEGNASGSSSSSSVGGRSMGSNISSTIISVELQAASAVGVFTSVTLLVGEPLVSP